MELAKAVVARDRKATAHFVQKYTDAVHSYIHRRLMPRTELVDDLVQEVILAAWKGLAKYEGDAPLSHWIMGIARFKTNDYYRSKLRAAVSFDDGDRSWEPEDRTERIDSLLDRSRSATKAAGVIAAMREEYGLLLRWKYWDNRSAREMASELGKTEKGVERMLARARQEFERMWTTTEGAAHAG